MVNVSETVWQFLIKLNINLPDDSQYYNVVNLSRNLESKCLHENECPSVYNSITPKG